MKYEDLNNRLIRPTINKNMLNMILVLYKQLNTTLYSFWVIFHITKAPTTMKKELQMIK